jgi:hypothetical protein
LQGAPLVALIYPGHAVTDLAFRTVYVSTAPDRHGQLVEHAMVRTKVSISDYDAEVPAGAVGTIVSVKADGSKFLVEFISPSPAIVSALRSEIEPA